MIRSAARVYFPMRLGLIVPVSVGVLAGWVQPIAIAQPFDHPVVLAQISDSQAKTVLYVNPVTGDDAMADGSERFPFKTITHALDVASPNTIVHLAPGTYSQITGEVFPISLKPHVTLQGNPDTRGQEVVIRGGGVFTSPSLAQQNIALLGGANQSSVIGITVTNPNPDGYGMLIESSSPTIANSTFMNNGRGGLLLVGNSQAAIRNNFLYHNGETNLRIQTTARPTVQENIIEHSDTGIIVADISAPIIVDNRITQNKTGVMVQDSAQPHLRKNSVEGNEQFGLFATAQARPDIGSATNADANFFRNNGKQDVALARSSEPPGEATGQPTVGATTTAVNQAPPSASPALTPLFPSPHEQATVSSQPTESTGLKAGHVRSPDPITPPPLAKSEKLAEQSTAPSVSSPSMSAPRAVVVPTVGTTIQPVPAISFGDRIPTPAPTPAASLPDQPIPPISQPPQSSVKPDALPPDRFPTPQSGLQNSDRSSTMGVSGVSAAGFPVPGSLQNTASIKPTPIRVMQLNTAPEEVQPSPNPSLTTIAVSSTPKRSTVPVSAPASVIEPSAAALVPVATGRKLKAPPARPIAQVDEIPAPPSFAPRPAPVVPRVESKQSSPQAVIRPTPISVISPITPVMPPARSPAIMIPVPPPEHAVPPVSIQNIQSNVPSQSTSLALADRETSASKRKMALLPVPGPDIPVGNIGDMPSVYSIRNQANPAASLASPGVGSVVVKYRVVVIAIDPNQQEQIRSIVPGAFPTLYRGQRVLQAGAFGDRTKAEELVASLNSQGLQALVEPLNQ